MKLSLAIFSMTVLVAGMFAAPLLANAQTYQQTIPTDKGSIKVGVSTEPATVKPNEVSKLKIDFLTNDGTIQQHIDYTVTITKDGTPVFKTIPTHTGEGKVTLPVQFKEGSNDVLIEVQGIFFRPIDPAEKITFSVKTGDGGGIVMSKEQLKKAEKPAEQKQTDTVKPAPVPKKSDKNVKSNQEKSTSKSPGTVKITKQKSDNKDIKKKDVKKTIKTNKKPIKKTEKS